MQLYSSPHSPFGLRVSIAAAVKGVRLEILRVPGGDLRAPAQLALNPIGRIPVLITDGTRAIPESTAILDYIEAALPQPAMLPADPAGKAWTRTLMQAADLYVAMPLIRLFPHIAPAQRDRVIVDYEFSRCSDGLDALSGLLERPLPSAEAGLTLADCVLGTTLHLCTRIAAQLGWPGNPVAGRAVLAAYYRRLMAHPLAGPALRGLTEAQEVFDRAHGLAPVTAWHETLIAGNG